MSEATSPRKKKSSKVKSPRKVDGDEEIELRAKKTNMSLFRRRSQSILHNVTPSISPRQRSKSKIKSKSSRRKSADPTSSLNPFASKTPPDTPETLLSPSPSEPLSVPVPRKNLRPVHREEVKRRSCPERSMIRKSKRNTNSTNRKRQRASLQRSISDSNVVSRFVLIKGGFGTVEALLKLNPQYKKKPLPEPQRNPKILPRITSDPNKILANPQIIVGFEIEGKSPKEKKEKDDTDVQTDDLYFLMSNSPGGSQQIREDKEDLTMDLQEEFHKLYEKIAIIVDNKTLPIQKSNGETVESDKSKNAKDEEIEILREQVTALQSVHQSSLNRIELMKQLIQKFKAELGNSTTALQQSQNALAQEREHRKILQQELDKLKISS